MPVYDEEKEKTTPGQVPDGSHDDLGVSPEQRQSEINDLEKAYSGDSGNGGATQNKEKTPSSDELADMEDSADASGGWATNVGNQAPRGRLAGMASRVSGMSWGKKGLLGGGIVGLLAAAAFGILSISPFELIHINQVGLKEIGGVQSKVYAIGRNRLYSTMFFFDQDAKFAGYKQGGIRRLMLENRQTKKLTSIMEKKGFKVEYGEANGSPTGKITRITYDGETIAESTSDLERAWDIKKDPKTAAQVRSALEEIFPEETARWYGKTSKKLWRRWGLTRTNWLKDEIRKKTGITALENKELEFRRKLRQRLFGDNSKISVTNTVTPEEEETNTTDGNPSEELDRTRRLDTLTESGAADAENLQKSLLDDPKLSNADFVGSLDGGEVAEDVARQAPASVVKGLRVTNAVDTACDIRAALSTLERGARVARATQLMSFALAVGTIGDGTQLGKVSGSQLSQMMGYINKKGDDGSNFFSSGGWQYYTGNKKSFKNGNRDKYATGGGFTGTLAAVNNAVDIGGASPAACKTLKNPFVQFGSAAAGIGLAVGSFGTSTVVNAGVSIGLDVAKNVALSIGTQLLIPIVAGTVVDGAEKGADIGDAWTSGFEVMNTANAANAGMRPLSNEQYAQLKQTYEQDQRTQYANMSLKERYFSTTRANSLTYAFANAWGSFKLSDTPTKLVSSFGSALGSLNPTQSALAEENVECTDPDIVDNNLAASPFCNLFVGIPENVLLDPNMGPADVDMKMYGDGHIDAEGNPKSDAYKEYVEQCTSENDEARSVDIIHRDSEDGAQEYTDLCSKNDLFNLYRMYYSMAEAENQALTDTLEDGTAPSTTQVADTTIEGDPFGPSEDVQCASGTSDLGVFDAYNSGTQVRQRLCAIPNIPSTSQESTPGDVFYINGADGKAIVNSRVSGAVYSMAQAAVADGVQLSARSSFRTMAHQEALWNSNPNPSEVAPPGQSNHQNGTAIDFDAGSTYGGQTCSARATAPGNKQWDWLFKNASRFSYYQYSGESWHWDPAKGGNRC